MLKVKTLAKTTRRMRLGTRKPKQSKLAEFVQKICLRLSKIKIKWRPVKYKSLIYEIGEWGPREGFEYWWDEFYDKITFRYFRQRVKQSLAYFKQGWENHDFDSAYALDDFIWKLGRLEKVISKYGHHVDSKEDAGKIHKTLELLKRVKEDEYDREEMDKLDEKWGKSVHYSAKKDDLFNWDVPSLQSGSTISFSKREKENDKNEAQIHRETRAAYRLAASRQKKDWKEALKLIEENFFSWWD